MKNQIQLINANHCRAVTITVTKMIKEACKSFFTPVFVMIVLLGLSPVFSSCKQDEKAVLAAYKLRIDGKVDEAKNQLEQILKEDSTNALAHYELARTLNYINLFGSEEATKALISAKTLEPENVIYQYAYAKNCFFETFKAMQMGDGDIKELLGKTCDEFDNVLNMAPAYPEAMMYLVEIYGILPPEMGGNKAKAEEYTKRLEKADNFYGAKARLVMMPQGTDMVQYWKDYITQNGENCGALKELGVAALFNDDIETAKVYFEKAMELDPVQNIRLLDLSRYHQMKVMQNRELVEQELPKAKEYIEQYLQSTPAPIAPLKAYAVGSEARIAKFLGNNDEAEKLMEEAKALDPHFSQAFGIPWLSIFEPPTQEDHFFASFFSPF
ncbi:tetratricopeptide repeat protein [Maribellus mangrovi]|uniref:tetratricopeptide repeat protein n=1 Tax=Maribellus mangrovi TaxID=3133146 RepID=UPI0030ED63A1